VQILGALCDPFSGILRRKIDELVCFHLITLSRSGFSERLDSSPLWFLLRLSVPGSSTLIQCLDSFFAPISLQATVLKTQQHFIGLFPMFLFLNLGREECQFGHMEKDFRPIRFPAMLDMTPSAFQPRFPCKYPLGVAISHMGDLGESQGH
jgi:hypothetical protein